MGSGGLPGVQAEQRLTVVRELLQVTQRSMRGMGPEQRQALQRVQQQQQQQQAWQQLDALVAGMPPDVAAAVRGWAPRLFRYPARLLAAALVHGQPLPPHVGAACAYAPRSLGQLGGDGQPTERQALQLCLLRLAFLDDVLHGRISPTGQAGREAAQGHLLRLLGTRRALAARAREAQQQRRAVPLPPAFLDQDSRLERWRSGVPAVLSEAGAQAEAEALAGRSGGDLWRDLCREYEHSLPFTAIAPLGVPGRYGARQRLWLLLPAGCCRWCLHAAVAAACHSRRSVPQRAGLAAPPTPTPLTPPPLQRRRLLPTVAAAARRGGHRDVHPLHQVRRDARAAGWACRRRKPQGCRGGSVLAVCSWRHII